MESKHVLKLIDVNFLPSDVGKVRFDLINCKINYHQIEKISNEVRFDKDLSNATNRIKQIQEMKNNLQEIISYTTENGMSLNIERHIIITCIKEK